MCSSEKKKISCLFKMETYFYNCMLVQCLPTSIFFPSVEHILGNLVMQLLLGIPLEMVHKGFEIGMVYMAGVIAGEYHLPLIYLSVHLLLKWEAKM